jgi:aryl carrier-like protein
VQYFPDATYLRAVLERAVALTAPGGIVHVGDVRSLPLLRAYHAAVQFHRATGRTLVADLRRRVDAEMARETELVIDPALFAALARDIPRIARVEIEPKRVTVPHELAAFRYQVRLHVESAAPPRADCPRIAWGGAIASVDALIDYVGRQQPSALFVEGVGNARVARATALMPLIDRDDLADVEALLAALRESEAGPAGGASGVEPEDVRRRLAPLGYELDVRWDRHDARGEVDLLVRRAGVSLDVTPVGEVGRAAATPERAPALVNDPLVGTRIRALVPRVREWLRERLTEAMVPAAFVMLDRLPVTANGKLDRRALPAPDDWRPDSGRPCIEPRTDIERQLVAIWGDILRIAKIGVHDNFLELGGDSILAIHVAARARAAGYTISPKQIFEHPTIAELALIAAPAPAADAPRSQAREYALSPLQEGLLYHSVDREGAYLVQTICRLEGDIDAAALRRAWALVLARHDALRTEFVWADGAAPRQRVCDQVALAWHEERWDGMTAADAEERVRAWLDRDRHRGVDVSRAPLTRLALLWTAPRASVLVWTHHHLLVDGWSSAIVLRELAEAYQAEKDRTPLAWADAPQYGDYIAWLRRQDAQAAAAYWRRLFEDAGPARMLPFARADVARGQRGRGIDGHVMRRWPRARGEAIVRFSLEHKLAPNTVAQGLWAIVLGWRTPRTDVMLGTVVSGRPADLPGAESIVGLFINTLPRRVPLPARRRAASWLRERQARESESRAFERTPLARIQAWAGLAPGDVLFHALFVFENYSMARVAEQALGVRVRDASSRVAETYPLVVTVTPGATWTIDLKFDLTRIDNATADDLLDQYDLLADELAARPDVTVTSLCALLQSRERLREAERAERHRTRKRELLDVRRRPVERT